MTDAVNVQNDVRRWDFYPIVMPLTKDGNGPASVGEIDRLTWEVWDRCHQSHASYDNLSDAINDCMSRNALAAATKAEQEPWDHAVRFKDYGWGYASELDAEQRELVLQGIPFWEVRPLYTHPAPASDELLEYADYWHEELGGMVKGCALYDGQQEYVRREDYDALLAKHKGPQS